MNHLFQIKEKYIQRFEDAKEEKPEQENELYDPDFEVRDSYVSGTEVNKPFACVISPIFGVPSGPTRDFQSHDKDANPQTPDVRIDPKLIYKYRKK